jgi:predicted Zn-dependent peptidase
MIRSICSALSRRTSSSHYFTFFAAALLTATALTTPARADRLLPEKVTGAGGAEIVLDRCPGSGSVLVAVAVRSGSAWEAPETRGVTHLLEHLLFDGSERFTREEISGWADDNGAFLNAFTRKEVTVYFLLARADLLEESIEILSQMLLHPVFSPDEIEKERKVVLEEMAHGQDDPGEAVSREADRFLYRGSSLTEPVIGYQSTMESVSRERIIEYYRAMYTPGRMRIFITGDFDRGRTLGWLDDYFTLPGAAGGAGVAGAKAPRLEPRWSGEVTTRVVEGARSRVDLLVRMPAAGDRLFPAAMLLSSMLESPSSPLREAAKKAGLEEPSAGLEVHEDFSALRISVEGKDGGPVDPGLLVGAVTSLSAWSPGAKELETAKTSFASSDIFDRERYHFYVMLNGEAMGVTGALWASSIEAAGRVKPSDISRLVEGYLATPMYNGFYAAPSMPGIRMERREARFQMLEGGMAVGARMREGSPVEALCLLFPGRACAGPQADAATAVFDILERSQAGKGLELELASIGARIQWGDNPYIPMDDYLINPSWICVRLETPPGRMREAALKLRGLLWEYRMPLAEIEAAASSIPAAIGARLGQSSSAMRKAIYGGLFPGHRYGEDMYRSPGWWAGPDSAAVRDVLKELTGGEGTAVTLVSAMGEEAGIGLLGSIFGDTPVSKGRPCREAPGPYEPGRVEGESGGSGAQLAAAWRLDSLFPGEIAALSVAAEALSRRMQLDIRETRGLAYSTGCSMTQVGGYAVVTASLGTRAENVEEAEKALRDDIEGLSADPIMAAEADAARSRLVSRLSRRELSSAGEALGIGLDQLFRGDKDGLELIAAAPLESVLEAVGRLRLEGALLVRLLPSGEPEEKKSMPPGMMGR